MDVRYTSFLYTLYKLLSQKLYKKSSVPCVQRERIPIIRDISNRKVGFGEMSRRVPRVHKKTQSMEKNDISNYNNYKYCSN